MSTSSPPDLREPGDSFTLGHVLILVAVVLVILSIWYRAYATNQTELEKVDALAKHSQHMAELAAAAEPVHPIQAGEAGQTPAFRCVSESGWQYTASSAEEIQDLCNPRKQDSRKPGGGGIPVFDASAFAPHLKSSDPRQK